MSVDDVAGRQGLSRRGFLRTTAIAGGLGAAQAFLAHSATAAPGRGVSRQQQNRAVGYGELSGRPPVNSDPEFGTKPLLALPEGFAYAAFGVEGTEMSDGNDTPRAHDGMAAFALPNGNVRLIRNHEDRNPPGVAGLDGSAGAPRYDDLGPGGTTSLEVEPGGNRQLVRDFVSLQGTIVNCAGGPTPWSSWLSCEETTEGRAQGWQQDHGYVFEIPASATDEIDPVALTAMGRFVHEAVAVDPDTGIIYETEDRNTAGFYRFHPDRPGSLADGGRLQMLKIRARDNYDTSTGQRVGRPLPVEWVDIADPDPASARANPLAVFAQGAAAGGAIFSRLEGCWHDQGSVFFNSTDGGEAEQGQVWQYRPRGNAGGQLTLLYESPGEAELDNPDNITVSPRGGLVLCEDGDADQYLRGLTQRGQVFDFALNLFTQREWAGATYSPDGETLFVNIQGDTRNGGPGNLGRTFAIWGPWEDGAL
ncbi:MAG: DUF839 domain-containing protein [Pseudonocardiaceae bacterium]|nr:DUF839 domain-containing protein [Pseudonocardiaceae bacterium]